MATTKYKYPLLWKSWYESRIRFFILLAALIAIVAYIVLTGPAFVKGYAKLHSDEPMDFNEYVWQSIFNYYLQGLWIGAVIILGLGGLLREYDLGVSMYTLSLPVSRNNLIRTRFLLGVAEAFALGIIPSLLIPLFSIWSGSKYPLFDAVCFGFLMVTAGVVIFSFTIFLSCIFSGEFTAFLISVVSIGTLFFIMKAKSLHDWSLFDVMNGAKSIDPKTHLIAYPLPGTALFICTVITVVFYILAAKFLRKRDL